MTGRAWGRDHCSSAGSLVLTCGFRQVAWAVHVSTEGALQGYLGVSQMWSILKLSASCHCTSSRGLKKLPVGGHCHPIDTHSISVSVCLPPSALPPFVLPSLPLPFLGQHFLDLIFLFSTSLLPLHPPPSFTALSGGKGGRE